MLILQACVPRRLFKLLLALLEWDAFDNCSCMACRSKPPAQQMADRLFVSDMGLAVDLLCEYVKLPIWNGFGSIKTENLFE